MTLFNSAEFARLYGDPDEDYNSFEKCVVRSIDALDSLVGFLEDFIDESDDPEQRKGLKSQRAVCISLRDSLRDWGLGIPSHE